MSALFQILSTIAYIFLFAIFGKVILSWIMTVTRNETIITIYQVLTQVTEPILGPLRRVIPPMGMFDLSPLVAIILLQVIAGVLGALSQ